MKKRKKVLDLVKKLVKQLKPFCRKIEIAGSIRREEKNPKDIDIVLVPKSEESKNEIKEFLSKKGKFIEGGSKEMTFKIEGIKVELYFSNSDEWGSMLLAFSGRKGSNIGLRIIARKKGFKLTRHGLFNRKTGKKIVSRTEKEIYKKLGREYKEPRDR